MYCISEQQIDFIFNDISARGIEMVNLQNDLVDHVCCIIEHNLKEDDDFERFYFETISTFYKEELKELEVETINLLIHKNYYVMKKIMLASGRISAALMTFGIIFKFMHWPGAAIIIFTGILLLSLVFLPLLFVIKAKEKKETKEKIVIGLGAISAILMNLGVLFKIMHWPFANMLCIIALMILVFLFLPIFYTSGIKNPETRVNTIVSSILIVAGSALILTLVRSPEGTKKMNVATTQSYLINERIYENEQKLVANTTDSIPSEITRTGNEIVSICNELKASLIRNETGQEKIDADFEANHQLIGSTSKGENFEPEKMAALKTKINSYNSNVPESMHKIELTNSLLETNNMPVGDALNNLIQMQMIVLQNSRM